MASSALVQQFVEVTQASDHEAHRLLGSADGDLETALAMYFASMEEGTSSSSAGPPPAVVRDDVRETSSPPPVVIGHSSEEEEALLGERRPQSAFECFKRGRRGPDPLGSGAGMFSALTQTLTSGVRVLTGVASEEFDDYFEANFGRPTPPISNLGYAETVRCCDAERKLILLWFHRGGAKFADELCTTVLQNEQVLDCLWEHYVVFGADVDRFEPSQIATLVGVYAFPALVILQPASRGSWDHFLIEWPRGTHARPIHRILPHSVTGFAVDAVASVIRSTALELSQRRMVEETARQETASRQEEARQLRAAQDAEYEDSLLVDQIRQISADEARTAQASNQGESRSAASDQLAPEVLDQFEATPSKLEPSTNSMEDDAREQCPSGGPSITDLRTIAALELKDVPEHKASDEVPSSKIMVRLPAGKRIERCFSSEAAVADIYAWADCAGELALLQGGERLEVPEQFQLLTSFPSKPLDDFKALLKDAGLVPSAALVMKVGSSAESD